MIAKANRAAVKRHALSHTQAVVTAALSGRKNSEHYPVSVPDKNVYIRAFHTGGLNGPGALP